MIGEGTRQLDLYDFFSIFIPGASLLLGVVPLIPQSVHMPPAAIIAVLIVGGVVVGRGIHAARLWIEENAGAPSHRDEFIDEILNPCVLTDDLINQFYLACQDNFDNLALPNDRSDLNRQSHADDLDMLYSLVRSKIHMDARGRSRTFQAVLDFYGSIWIASSLLFSLYYSYATIDGLTNGWSTGFGDVIGYQSYLSTYDIHYAVIAVFAVGVWGGAYYTFYRVRSDYREIYIQYFMSDFVILQNESGN
ncbi:hypothetical protein [Haloarcula amylovorans]|uniref:hypothetical protein n=1 Tax=Haloarcula amylovorans TaxID=2562280 RepID=UPI001075EE2E|nr:hypothetical protein [Halomicroarcula amylolytica]